MYCVRDSSDLNILLGSQIDPQTSLSVEGLLSIGLPFFTLNFTTADIRKHFISFKSNASPLTSPFGMVHFLRMSSIYIQVTTFKDRT